MELLEENHRIPQPSSYGVSELFTPTTSPLLRDTSEVLHSASLWFAFPPEGYSRVQGKESKSLDSELKALGGRRKSNCTAGKPRIPWRGLSLAQGELCRPWARETQKSGGSVFCRNEESTSEHCRGGGGDEPGQGQSRHHIFGLTGGRAHLGQPQMLSSSSILLTPSQILLRWVR